MNTKQTDSTTLYNTNDLDFIVEKIEDSEEITIDLNTVAPAIIVSKEQAYKFVLQFITQGFASESELSCEFDSDNTWIVLGIKKPNE